MRRQKTIKASAWRQMEARVIIDPLRQAVDALGTGCAW